MKVTIQKAEVEGFIVKDYGGNLQMFDDEPVYNIHDEEWHGHDITGEVVRYLEDVAKNGSIYRIKIRLELCKSDRDLI